MKPEKFMHTRGLVTDIDDGCYARSPADPLILPFEAQVKAWRKANRRMRWGIRKSEFNLLEDPGPISPDTDFGPEAYIGESFPLLPQSGF